MFIAHRRRRLVLSALAVTAVAITGCSSSKGKVAASASPSATGAGDSSSAPAAPTSAPAASAPVSGGAPVTITIGDFGTFGYKEAGLYDAYMKLHPNVTIKEDTVQQSSDYYKALQTHLAAGSGLDDIQAIEIGFVADITANHADQFVDFNSLPEGAQLKSTFYPWKWSMASTSDGKTLGVGTDAGPEAMCYRTDLLKAAGLPSDRATLNAQWATWDGFIKFGQQYQASANKPAGSHFLDSAASVFNTAVTQGTEEYNNSAGKPDVANSDGVKTAWALATKAAQAKITAGLGQFTTPWNKAFANGAFAAIACPSWMTGYITSQAGQAVSGSWDVANLPGGAANWGGSWLGVPKAGKHQAEAAALAEWLTAPAQQVTMWTSQGHFPSSSTAAKDPAVAAATSDYFNKAPVGQIFGDSASKLKMVPIGPYDTQIQSALTTALGNVETKGLDPAKAFSVALKNIAQITGG
ncbi:MAG: cellobiose transport system substrate-binding protein [Actinomycetota bacterium]|jgi:cellobiose transport system substrate-binding protein|nr:cellobiose transport system substrate-binding protein [Actinomycetota bacterium]